MKKSLLFPFRNDHDEHIEGDTNPHEDSQDNDCHLTC